MTLEWSSPLGGTITVSKVCEYTWLHYWKIQREGTLEGPKGLFESKIYIVINGKIGRQVISVEKIPERIKEKTERKREEKERQKKKRKMEDKRKEKGIK